MNQLNPTNQTLNFRRMGFLARRDLLQYWRGMLIVAAGNTGVMIVITILGIIFSRASYGDSWRGVNYDGWFTGLMIIWGCIAASAAFGELHDKNRNQDFLLLPASALEKTLMRLLLVSLVLPLFIVVLMVLDSLIAESIRFLVQGGALTPFNPFGSGLFDSGQGFGNLRIIRDTIVLQSVFFLGAAWFRKAHFIKTVLGAAAVSTAFSLFASLVFYIVFGPLTGMDLDFNPFSFVPGRFQEFFRTLKVTLQILAFAVLPLFCWFTAWLRVKETQSSHGV